MQHADLTWDESGTPCSTQFDDVYFSKVGGLDETRHVFLAHNQLPERFDALSQQKEHTSFVIGETGFGTGLNFLACCQLWQKHLANSDHELVFISTEKFPLTPDDLKKALAVWPELNEWSDPLIQAYPTVCSGIQTLIITPNIRLMIAFGDAAESFSKLNAQVDAWFLDGFAPSKNPEMWSDSLFEQIQRLSGNRTTFATFTAARVVKDLLTNHGFNFKKAKGFGRKRDMLQGHFTLNNDHEAQANTEVWFKRPHPYHAPLLASDEALSAPATSRSAIVIGAGLSGAHTAYGLAKRGWQVTVLEQGNEIASGASGNYQGVLYTKPSVQETKEDRFYLASFQYAVQHYQHYFSDTEIWQQAGLLQLAQTEKESEKLRRVEQKYQGTHFNLSLSKDEAEQAAGIPLHTNYSALFYPDSGWVNPAAACRALLDHPNINVRCQTKVRALKPSDKNWYVDTETATSSEQLGANIVVLASAWESNRFDQAEHLSLTPIRGQVSQVKMASLPPIKTPKTVICSDSYVTPCDQDKLNFGATFDLKDSGMKYRSEDVDRNLTKLAAISSEFETLKDLDKEKVSGRASVRCITNDRLPVVGMLNNHPAMIEQYQQLRKDRKWPYQEPGPYHNGLYVNLGHGSKGLTTIPLCSELLCAEIENAPLPLPQDLVDALNPSRFTISGLIKKKY